MKTAGGVLGGIVVLAFIGLKVYSNVPKWHSYDDGKVTPHL